MTSFECILEFGTGSKLCRQRFFDIDIQIYSLV